MDSRLKRGRISSEVKSKVVLEALREVQTLSQIGISIATSDHTSLFSTEHYWER